MSEAKDELVKQKELTVAKMKDWENQTGWCLAKVQEILRDRKSEPVSAIEGPLKEIENRLATASKSLHTSSDDLDHLDNFFKFQRSNLEVRKFAFDSWPTSRYVEQMLWVATVLVSLGGGAFATGMVLTTGDLLVSVIAPLVFWGIGLYLLAASLKNLKKIDDQKMEFYRDEFGLQRDLPPPGKGEVKRSGWRERRGQR